MAGSPLPITWKEGARHAGGIVAQEVLSIFGVIVREGMNCLVCDDNSLAIYQLAVTIFAVRLITNGERAA